MKRVAIIGAGISGLFIANLFLKNSNYQVTIFEKNNSINLEEGYGIQLSINSIKLLNEIGFNKLDKREKYNPIKIDFYANENFKKICELNISDFNSEKFKYTTLKRSVLINFLKKDLDTLIQTNHEVSKIDQNNKFITLSFRNNKTFECDYLIISDGVFSKSKSLISNKQISLKYYDVLAIRGSVREINDNFNDKNISLFLGSNFHYVVYPVNSNRDFNFIAIIRHKLSKEELKNYSLFNDKYFIQQILDKTPSNLKRILDKLKEVKIFPVFVSKDFYKLQKKNIHLIGDAFFAYPPSFAQGASQSIEGAYELYKNIENNTEDKYLINRLNKTKMVNNRSRFNQFAFHLSNPFAIFFRNIFLKRLVRNKKFLENYLGKIYRN